jgi:predicted nuclease of predicted toxin-antitoxin system
LPVLWRPTAPEIVNFLIDECLHTSLVAVARERGYGADHVSWLGLSGTADWDLMPIIVERDLTFVTNNASDFRRLYGSEVIHAGLVIIVPNVRPALQRELFTALLDYRGDSADLVNEVLEVRLEQGEIQIDHYKLPTEG